uniref:Uncharacterized protein n=1 Tax=Heterorhabditis bacteriophora TaxID=37862 RepID=A0A1I7WI50_HETBA
MVSRAIPIAPPHTDQPMSNWRTSSTAAIPTVI